MGDGLELKSIAVFAVTDRAYGLAQKVAGRFRNSVVFEPSRLKRGGLAKEVGRVFRNFDAIFFICASGIAVRSVAPFLRGKDLDPAVVLMDEKAKFVVSLLSGHLGGANRLAGSLAGIYGATPVITTATDVMGLPCVEDIAEDFSFAIEDVKKIKNVNSAILSGESIPVIDKDALRLKAIKASYGDCGAFKFHKAFPKGVYRAFILVSSSTEHLPRGISRKTLVLRPREFVVGIGCRKGVSVKEVEAAVKRVFGEAGLSTLSIKKIATADLKKEEKGLLRFARKKGIDIDFVDSSELLKITPPSGRSAAALKNIGLHGVCEPAALYSARTGRIWIKKKKIGRVTIAAAKAPFMS